MVVWVDTLHQTLPLQSTIKMSSEGPWVSDQLKRVVVFGGTGAQGKSVVKGVRHFSLRAHSSNPPRSTFRSWRLFHLRLDKRHGTTERPRTPRKA